MKLRNTITAIAVIGLAVAAPLTANAAADTTVKAKLSGSEVVPGPGDANGKGKLKATVEGDQFCYKVKSSKIGAVTDVSIYSGATGETGDVVVTLEPSGHSSACLTIVPDAEDTTATVSESEAAAILADPSLYYVEVRTEDYPAGAIRGQLK